MKLYHLLSFLLIQTISNKFYRFSIIIAIYNSGRYLEETIQSLINQVIGFSKIQIILVNDGSTDNTENICLKYKYMYKNNIIYTKTVHSGVSQARNIGLKFVKGMYINFLDSDDKWDSNAFTYINLFFKFYKNVDIVSGRMKYFEARTTYHFLDYKFKKTKVVNLIEEYSYIQLSCSSSFFRKNSIKNNKFEEGILFGEDIRFITTNFLAKPLLGLIKEAIYYYRKRRDSTSAIQNTENNIYYYFVSLIKVHQFLIDKSISLYNIILPFIQYFIAYEMIFRLKSKAFLYLDKTNYKRYCYEIQKIINQIDDKYFLEQKIFSSKLVFFAISKKHNNDLRYDIILKNNSFIYYNYTMINLKKYKNIITWRLMKLNENILHLEGEDRCWLPAEKYNYFCKYSDIIFYPKFYAYPSYDFITMYGVINKGRIVVFDIILNNNDLQKLHFFISYGNNEAEIFPSIYSSTHIPPIKYSYYIKDEYIIKNNQDHLIILPQKLITPNSLEQDYCTELKKQKKENIIYLRKEYLEQLQINKCNNNQIWIISDRLWEAKDNGEYFFRYLSKKKPKGIKYYFTIKKNSTDFKRLKAYGNVLDLDSSEYLNIFIKSDKILSSSAESWVRNPLGEETKYIIDLFHFNFIYLQNGIIKDDLSIYLNKIAKNIDLIITSSNKEYNSFLNYYYGYKENNIALTGLSRFDNLKHLKLKLNRENIILISPTWRSYIKGTLDALTYKSIPSENFKKTNFFNFYNKLIEDINLLSFMEKNNYRGIFCLHPNFEAEWRYFNTNRLFIIKEKCNIQELLVKSSLLITDYSSIFFDFAYLEKPIIYVHFDYQQYRINHFKKGYFDYKADGFGLICYDITCTREAIILSIKKNCKLKKLYQMRIKKFFRYFDDNNNQRIFFEINKYKDSSREKQSTIKLYYIFVFIFIKIFKEYYKFNII